jgi:3-deoxy-D-manno-octulosonic-acid transferase
MVALSLWLYRILLRVALPVVVPTLWIRDRATGKRRPPIALRLGRWLPEVPPRGIWMQAVSVGEVEVARRVVDEFARRPEPPPLLVTATTATGLDLAHRAFRDRVPVAACPVDLVGPVARVLDRIEPRLLVLVETELWPELIHQAHRRGTRVAVINGRISDDALPRYRVAARCLAPLLSPIDLVLARGVEDGERFAALGVERRRIRVLGNVKYDLEPDTRPLDWHQDAVTLAGDRPLVVVGSTMDGEERLVLDALDLAKGRCQQPFVVLAPRHPERFDAVARLLRDRGVRTVRRSAIAGSEGEFDLLLLDTIGELARAYRLAAVAVVGGSLVTTGGHNPLEPAVWGVPVLSGPHVENFQEVYREMTAAGGARIVHDAVELGDALVSWLNDAEAARTAGEAGRTVVEVNRGATARTVDALLALVNEGR